MNRPTPPTPQPPRDPIDPFFMVVIVALVLAIGFVIVSIVRAGPECTPNHTADGCRVTGSP